MEKHELIVLTAKEMFLKDLIPITRMNLQSTLKDFDEGFKAIVKTISEAYESITPVD